jgi:hypothetical protein
MERIVIDIMTRNDGTRGEQDAGFLLGEAGYFVVEGPSGAGGHAANAPRPDGVAYNPQTRDMIIYDVKYYLRAKNVNVGKSTALVENLDPTYFDGLIQAVRARPDIPEQQEIISRLQFCKAGLATRSWPAHTRVAIVRTSGQAAGITSNLASKNVVFIDLNADPTVQRGKYLKSTKRSPKGGTPSGVPDIGGLIQGAHAFIKTGLAEHWGTEAVSNAIREYNSKEKDIHKLRRTNPGCGVRVVFYFQVQRGVNNDFPDYVEYIGLNYQTRPGGRAVPPYYQPLERARTVEYIIDFPSDPAAKRPEPGHANQLELIMQELSQPDYVAAYKRLNGCSMDDMLRVLDHVRRSGRFNELLDRFSSSAIGVYRERILVALTAVSFKGQFTGLKRLREDKSVGPTYQSLPSDQRAAIDKYLSAP